MKKRGRKAQRRADRAQEAAKTEEQRFEEARERGECWCTGYYAFDEALPGPGTSAPWVRCPIHSP